MIRAMLLAALAAAPATPGLAAPKAKRPPPQAVAATEYLFSEPSLYELIAAPGRITDIVLEPGETLVEANPIAAGDTARWVIGDTSSGEGESRRVHVLVKPTQDDLSTNLLINTSRRTYHLQMRASSRAFLAQIAWRYPARSAAPAAKDQHHDEAVVAKPPVAVADPVRLNFDYRVKGAARWRPARVYDDGVRTFIEFGPSIVLTDLPPLFLIGPDGKGAELINYGVVERRLVIDRLFDRAELRIGLKRWRQRIRIERLATASRVAR